MRNEIIGCVVDILIHFYDSGTSVLLVETDQGKTIQMKGRTEGEEEVGMTYRFGVYDTRKYRGKDQHLFHSWCLHEPSNPKAIERYLCRAGVGFGLGERTAFKIVDDLGADSLQAIRDNPYIILNYNKRMKERNCEAIGERLRGWKKYEATTLELDSLLSKYAVRKTLSQDLIKAYGVDAPTVVRSNPYRLLKYAGIGFAKADAMWVDFGLPLHKLKRQLLAAVYGLEQRRNGSIWFPATEVAQIITAHVGGTNVDVPRALMLGKRSGLLEFHREDDSDSGLWVALGYVARAERQFAKEIKRISDGKSHLPPASYLNEVSDHQREIYRQATENQSIAILGGGPGTGKTFTAAQIILRCMEKHGSDAIAVCAPTGKAALRLSEALREYGANVKVKTIHSLLKVQGSPADGFTFAHSRKVPLPYKFYFIDEFSMPDILIANSLFQAIPEGANVLCIGDINQLPPVGPGAPLRDMLPTVSNAVLTETRRNSGRIVNVCKQIRDKEQVEFSKWLDNRGENCKLIEIDNTQEITTTLLRGIEMAESNGMDPKWDVQTLVAVNEKGDLSRKAINKMLQDVLNPNGYSPDRCPFRLGDKVVRLKNQLVYAIDENGQRIQTHICNGDLAEVTRINKGIIEFTLRYPTRIVKSGFKTATDGWDLGYALSCHKSQGSEWPLVFVLLDDSGAGLRVASREWIYTAISRGKKKTILLGKHATFERMRSNQVITKRKTITEGLLRDLLQTNVDTNVPRVASQVSERGMCETNQHQPVS